MDGHDSVISCVNYWYNESLSHAAIETGTNFCDLGGNNYVVDAQLALDAEAKAAGIKLSPIAVSPRHGIDPGVHGAQNSTGSTRSTYASAACLRTRSRLSITSSFSASKAL